MVKIRICLGSSCFARGNQKIMPYLEQLINNHDSGLELSVCLCQDQCQHGPNISIDDHDYGGMSLEKIREFLENAGICLPEDEG